MRRSPRLSIAKEILDLGFGAIEAISFADVHFVDEIFRETEPLIREIRGEKAQTSGTT